MATITASAAGGNSNATGTWVGGVVPGASDDVKLASTSGPVTINAVFNCLSFDCTGYTNTLTWPGSAVIACVNNFTLVAGMTLTLNTTGGTPSLVITGTCALTTAGKTMALSLFANSGTTTFQDNWVGSPGGVGGITLGGGTLNTNGRTVSTPVFSSSNATARTLTLGASAITLTNGGTAWNTATVTGFTVTANTATVTLTGASATWSSGTINWNGMGVVMSGSGSATIAGTNPTVASFTRTGTAAKTDLCILSATSLTCSGGTGAFICNGNTLTNRVLLQTSQLGFQRTITAATVTLTNVDIQDISGAGTGTWSGTSVGNAGGCTGITFTSNAGTSNGKGGVNRYCVANGGSWSSTAIWSTTSNGAGGATVPLPQDSIFLTASTAGTITADMPRIGGDLDCTGFTGTLALTNQTNSVFGNIIFVTGMTLNNSQNLVMQGRGAAQTFTSGGKTFGATLFFSCPGGKYTLQDNLIATTINPQFGELNDGGHAVSVVGQLQYQSGVTRTLTSTGIWTFTGSTPLNITATAATYNVSGATWIMNGGATAQAVNGLAGVNLPNLQFNTGSGTATVAAASSWNTITVNTPKTVHFTAGVAQTIRTPGGFYVTGTAGNLGTFDSTVAGIQWSISCSAGTISCDYISLKDSNAIGGATFFAGAHSTNVSNNSGWSFTSPVFADNPTGALVFAGANVEDKLAADSPSGIFSLLGSLVEAGAHGSPPVGGIVLSGLNVEVIRRISQPSGSLILSGAATEGLQRTSTPLGSLILTGSNQEAKRAQDSPTGVLVISGDVTHGRVFTDAPVGSVRLSGDNLEALTYTDVPVGVLVLLGSNNEVFIPGHSITGPPGTAELTDGHAYDLTVVDAAAFTAALEDGKVYTLEVEDGALYAVSLEDGKLFEVELTDV